MTAPNPKNSEPAVEVPKAGVSAGLSESEKARIREELRYAKLVLGESKQERAKGAWEKIADFLSNGFVILLVGAAITSFAVPAWQRSYEEKKQTQTLMEECRAEFLLYCNSIWEEFYLIHPLVSETSISKPRYDEYFQKLTEIKLRRYNAFAKLQSVAIAFRADTETASDVEQKLETYAVTVNQVSQGIDTWLRRLYCYTAQCDNETIEVDYSSYDAFVRLHDKLDETEQQARIISELIVKHIKRMAKQ